MLAVAASALLFAWWTGVASAANGTLEICKAPDNGAAGQPFAISYAKGSGAPTTITVNGGSCSPAISVAAGNYNIQEDLSSGLWQMVGAVVTPSANWLSENDLAGKVKVAVVAGAETQVVITNAPASASLKICKWSATPAFQGAEYSFTVSGHGTVTAVAGPNAAHPGCSGAVVVQPGSRLTVTESVPSGQQVAGVSKSSNVTIRSQVGGVVRITVGTGANILTFDNEPVGPPQTGLIEVCKNAGDQFISWTKPFTFTLTDSTGAANAQTVNVLAGQCSGPLTVAAGNVNVAETVPDGNYVSDVELGANSAGSLGPVNLTNGTAVVVVPVASAGEAQVVFTNSTIVTTLKVCKYLTASSGSLAGQKFWFTLTDSAGTQVVGIVAQIGAAGACKNVGVVVPVGDVVTAVETAMPYVGVNGGAPGAGGTVVITAVPGINTISFTNQAYGQIEICKNMVRDDPIPHVIFNFSVDGSKTTQGVAAARCGQPQIVTAGTHTVTEVGIPYGYQFVSSSATGPTGDNRDGSGGNPITVQVPYFFDATNGGETLVTFVDKVQRVQIKICKEIEAGSETSIGGLTYSFSGGVSGDGTFGPVTVYPPYPGPLACTGLLLNAPIVDPSGAPVTATVVEAGGPFTLAGATVSGGTGVSISGYTVTWTPGVGVNVVTITNRARPVGTNP